MAEADHSSKEKAFYPDIPQESQAFYLKGSNGYGWGMQHRLSKIFNPQSGRTVMLAFDHGYFQGPTTGLERIDLAIRPLAPYADSLMCTRGALRSMIEPGEANSVVMRASGGPSILKELSNELLAVSVEDALRMNVSAVAVQTYIGGEYETQTVNNMTRMVDECMRYDLPVLGVTAVGKELTRDARYIGLASRMLAELGASVVKTYFVPGFEQVTAGCPVPIVIAGGKKLPEKEALQMARDAIDQGAAGVDMGRNIFQSDDPEAMIQAVGEIVHEDVSVKEAYQLYEELKNA